MEALGVDTILDLELVHRGKDREILLKLCWLIQVAIVVVKMAGLVTKVVVLLQVRLDYGHGEPAPAPGEFLDIAGDLPEGFSVVIRVIQIFDTAKTGLLELRRAML